MTTTISVDRDRDLGPGSMSINELLSRSDRGVLNRVACAGDGYVSVVKGRHAQRIRKLIRLGYVALCRETGLHTITIMGLDALEGDSES